jgi:hypothetical protein
VDGNNGGLVTVHIWGLPADGSVLRTDERTCDSPDAQEIVVFHIRPVANGHGGWACLQCGVTTDDRERVIKAKIQ